MLKTRVLLIALTFHLLTACTTFTDSGDGTGTLQVKANMNYAAGGAVNAATLTVEVRDANGDNVSGAQIILTDDATGEQFSASEPDPVSEAGIYTLSIPEYRRRVFLQIEKDSHRLSASLEGPGPHTIATPTHGTNITLSDEGDELEVQWHTEDGIIADHVTICLGNTTPSPNCTNESIRFSSTVDHDTGETTIPTTNILVGIESITVVRRNKLLFAKGLNSSTFEISYTVQNSFQVGQ